MKYLTLTLLSLLALNVSAQSFDLYASAGPVLSQIDGDRIGGYDKMGLVFGLGIEQAVSGPWKGFLELNYIQKGKGVYNESDGSTKRTVLHYVDLPLIAGYQVIDQLVVQAGVSFGVLIDYQFYEDGSITTHYVYTPNRFDVDYLVGASYILNASWQINLRLASSIFAMGDQSPDDTYRPNIWRNPGGKYNRSLALTFQYWF